VVKSFAAAVDGAQEARDLCAEILGGTPGSDCALALLLEDQGLLTLSLIRAGRIAHAAASCDEIAAAHAKNRTAQARAASYMVKCGEAARAAAKANFKLPDRSGDYFARAVELLRDAIQIMPFPPAEFDREEFQSLRGREDFEALRRSLTQPPRSG
jgi:hypothetical protein